MGVVIDQLIAARHRWLTWQSAAAVALWGGFNLIALAVFGRWLAGALTAQPPVAETCAVAGLTALLGLAAYGLFRQLDFHGEHWSWGAAPVFLTLFPLMVIVAVVPRQPVTSVWFTGTLGLLTAVVLLVNETIARHSRNATTDHTDNLPQSAEDNDESLIDAQLEARLAQNLLGEGAIGESPDIEETFELNKETSEEPWHAPDVSQWMTRTDSPTGEIMLEGVTVAEFALGQQRTVVHLAFCPPLPSVPRFECEPTGGENVRLKLGAVYPHGVRIDVSRSTEQVDACQIGIGYFAHTEATPAAA